MEKVILAYSGGLDTSVAIKWVGERYNLAVVALTIDVGANRELGSVQGRALEAGAVKAVVIDARELFVKHFVFPALQAGAIYEGQYPLATALARPLIAKLMVDVAREEGATAVAHGCTGKGNDQVRFDVSTRALAPDLRIIAPMREWKMSREEEIEYAMANKIPVPVTKANPYSIDENLWGRSIECGVLEDPWIEPPEDIYAWTKNPAECAAEPTYLEIEFDQGVPVALDGQPMGGMELIGKLNEIAGQNGVGRVDHVENRLVGIKSREIYENPAATVLHQAHQSLEALTMTKDSSRFKQIVSTQYADLVYNGLWFSPLHQDLQAYVSSSQRHVTGAVRVKLSRGRCTVVGRKSPKSLYSEALATYDKADSFDHDAALGFIKLWGLPLQTQARAQRIGEQEESLAIESPRNEKRAGS